MTTYSTTKRLDAAIRQRDLDTARDEGFAEGRRRGPALYPSAYARDHEKSEAWLDGYFAGMQQPQVTP